MKNLIVVLLLFGPGLMSNAVAQSSLYCLNKQEQINLIRLSDNYKATKVKLGDYAAAVAHLRRALLADSAAKASLTDQLGQREQQLDVMRDQVSARAGETAAVTLKLQRRTKQRNGLALVLAAVGALAWFTR